MGALTGKPTNSSCDSIKINQICIALGSRFGDIVCCSSASWLGNTTVLGMYPTTPNILYSGTRFVTFFQLGFFKRQKRAEIKDYKRTIEEIEEMEKESADEISDSRHEEREGLA